MNGNPCQRICVVQLARFGDLIQSSPLLQRLKQTHPSSFLRLVVDQRTAPVASILDGVDEVLPLNLSSSPFPSGAPLGVKLAALRRWAAPVMDADTFDLLIVLNQDTLAGAVAELIDAREWRGPRLRCRLPAPHRYLTLALRDRRWNPIHLCEIWAAYSDGFAPLPAPRLKQAAPGTGFALLSRSSHASSMKIKRFAINLGASAAGRRPPWEKLAELTALLLLDPATEIVLLGLAMDRIAADRIAARLPEADRGRLLNLTGKTRLDDLPGILCACDLLISADTGTLQLAAATGTPCIGLFMAGANPVETGPYRQGAVAIVRRDTLDRDENELDDLHDLPLNSIAKLTRLLAEHKTPQERDVDADDAFTVFVARPDGLGIHYTSLHENESVPLDKAERWKPLLRRLIQRIGAGKIMEAGQWALADDGFPDLDEGLMRILDDPGWHYTGEGRWLGTILQAFQGELETLLVPSPERHRWRTARI